MPTSVPSGGWAAEPSVPVTFRFRPRRPVQCVELRGDMVHWRHLLDMERVAGGWYEATLSLEVGTYVYKFRIADGEWACDPHNPRTRTVDGVRNSLLCVGGTDEPIVHAPSRSYVWQEDDGRLGVRAGLRHHAGQSLTLRWDEGHGAERVAMQPVARDDDLLLLEAHIPASAETVHYLFVLPDGRCVGRAGGAAQAFHVELDSLEPSAPAWWREAVLYTVFVDRFRPDGSGGRWPAEAQARLARDEEGSAGGNLLGVTEALPHLVELGVTALHLTPVFIARSAHRYDVVEPRQVDPELGGDEALRALVAAAHARGLRVLLDPTVTHVHRDFAPFQHVCAHGPASPYWDWFVIRRFPFGQSDDPGYDHYQKGRWQEPLLNLAHPEVADYVVATFEHWTSLGIDGFRLDAAADIPLELCRRIRRAVRARQPDAVMFAEVTVDNIRRWSAEAADSCTDFCLQQVLYDWLWRRAIGASVAAERLSRRRFERAGPAWTALAFTATHDQPRFATLVDEARMARLAHLLVLLGPEIPAIYYGDEVGLCSGEDGRDFEGAWPDRMCMPWDPGAWDHETLDLFRHALQLRRSIAAIARGDTAHLSLTAAGEGEDALLGMRRTAAGQTVDILLNGGRRAHRFELPPAEQGAAEILLRVGPAELDGTAVELGPWAALVLRRVRSPQAAQAWRDVLTHSRALAAEAFVQGLDEAVALPTHLYLTVTEACNLRCRHCINHSGALTASGRARQLRPWLIERLGDALAAAHYVGFAHGGESLVSPVLFDVLAAIARRQAAAGAHSDVHLLTNGMLLTPEMTRRLVELGVNSIAVSLDGATAQTNDAIRVGASFHRILSHLRAAVALRATESFDLRLGISTVVTARNVAELPRLAQLVVDLGVDWLKLEELCPVNAFCQRELVASRAPAVVEGLCAVQQTLAPADVVLVNHLEPQPGCDCQARDDPALSRFRQADNFANRAHFHPCRAAWEQACIDPDGKVHPVDYHQPPLGSLIDTPLFELWDGPAARRLRAGVLRTFPSELRTRCPVHGDGEAPP